MTNGRVAQKCRSRWPDQSGRTIAQKASLVRFGGVSLAPLALAAPEQEPEQAEKGRSRENNCGDEFQNGVGPSHSAERKLSKPRPLGAMRGLMAVKVAVTSHVGIRLKRSRTVGQRRSRGQSEMGAYGSRARKALRNINSTHEGKSADISNTRNAH